VALPRGLRRTVRVAALGVRCLGRVG